MYPFNYVLMVMFVSYFFMCLCIACVSFFLLALLIYVFVFVSCLLWYSVLQLFLYVVRYVLFICFVISLCRCFISYLGVLCVLSSFR